MKEAKKQGICPKTIILSGYDSFSYAQQALRLGAVDYLLKPCRSTEICDRLRTVLNLDREEEKAEVKKCGNKQEHLSVRGAQEYIREHLTEELNLKLVADKVGISTAYLSTLFKQYLGCGFVDYLNKIRIEYACNYMQDGELSLIHI